LNQPGEKPCFTHSCNQALLLTAPNTERLPYANFYTPILGGHHTGKRGVGGSHGSELHLY